VRLSTFLDRHPALALAFRVATGLTFFVIGGLLMNAGIWLIRLGTEPYDWRSLVGGFAIVLSWKSFGFMFSRPETRP
jgi:hypothetical protein